MGSGEGIQGGRSVFIVEDDAAIREFYRKLFQPESRELDVLPAEPLEPEDPISLRMFERASALLVAFEAEFGAGRRVPLCILDSGRPDDDGLDAARAILDRDPDVVIVVCSASPSADADELRRRLRSSVFLVRKPFAADEFRLLIHSLLREWETRQVLRLNQDRLRRVIEGTRVGTWEWDLVSGEIAVNDRWAEIVGYSLSELEPTTIRTWEALVHPEDGERSAALLESHFSGALPYYDCECRMRHKDGRWIWVHDRGKVIERDPSGKPLVMSGTHTDISDRKLAELEREEISKRLESVIEATSSAIWDWDIRTNTVSHNARWCEALGLDQSYLEHPLSFFFERIFPEDRGRVDEAIKACLEGRGPYSSTHRLVRSDGSVIWALDRGNVVDRDAEGRPTRMVGSLIRILEKGGG
jgi:PAS domain S-box-containing protein